MGKIKAHEIRTKGKSDLLSQLSELKTELTSLRVAQVTNGAPAKLAKIGVVRKNIARVLTVYNQLSKSKLREKYVADTGSLPRDLRLKKTRAIRRRLTPQQAAKKTLRQQKKDAHFSPKVFGLKAV